MSGITVSCDISKVIKGLEQEKKNAQLCISRTLSDVRRSAPGWVSTEIRKEYNIKTADIKEAQRIRGDSVESLAIEYTGRTLTAVHFGMSPKSRAIGGKKKDIVVEIKKGQKKILHSNPRGAQPTHKAFLIPGKKPPFQRSDKFASGVDAIRSLSVPQMVATGEDVKSGDVKPEIAMVINEKVKKIFDGHAKRLL